MHPESNYIYPESTWKIRLLSAVCVGALFGGVYSLISYSYAFNVPEPKGQEEIVEVAFFEPEAPMPLGEQLEEPEPEPEDRKSVV